MQQKTKAAKVDGETETWVGIPGYPRYKASTFGNIARVHRKGHLCLLNPYIQHGYYQVGLRHNNIRKVMKKSVAIAIAFHNHKPCGMLRVVDHKDEDKLNDRPDNLQIITNRENINKTKNKEFPGITRVEKRKKWKARITINGKKLHLGYFSNPLMATNAYKEKLNQLI